MKTLLQFTALAVSLFVCGCSSTVRSADQSSWEVLFDGKSTAAFRGFRQATFPTESWAVIGGAFHVSEAAPETYMSGPEMQIVDDANTEDGANPMTSAGSLYDLIAPTNKTCHPAGEWNRIRLIVQGHHVEYWMNGARIVEYELGSTALQALIANSKFKDWPRFATEETGYLALQSHGNSVWFRNIRVRRL
jgi:hypothetical protein